jgi:hypothetical protein
MIDMKVYINGNKVLNLSFTCIYKAMYKAKKYIPNIDKELILSAKSYNYENEELRVELINNQTHKESKDE